MIYPIGELIREHRRRKGLSQEALCEGICSAVTISRIENGVQFPTLRVLQMICERLGISMSSVSWFCSNEEIKIYNLKIITDRNISIDSYDELYDNYKKLKELVYEEDAINTQFVEYIKAILVLNGNTKLEIEDMIMHLTKALRITLHEFDAENLDAFKAFSSVEIRLMNCLAIEYFKANNTETSLKLLWFLKKYLETNEMDIEEYSRWYPLIIFNLSNVLGTIGMFETALNLCEKGIGECVRFSRLKLFPYFIFNKACSYASLERKKEATVYFNQSYVILKAMGSDRDAERIKQTALSQYDCELSSFVESYN